MQKFFGKNWVHLLVLGVIFIYPAIAYEVYSRFFVLDGKSVEFSQALPPISDKFRFAIEDLNQISSNGQELYVLSGWSFFVGDADQTNYEQLIVLKSAARTYFFPAEFSKRPELPLAFSNIDINILNSGFHARISKQVIQPGVYIIGILYRNKSDNAIYYTETTSQLRRTPNQLKLENIEGKRVKFNQQLPLLTGEVKFAFSPLISNPKEKNMYVLWGWSFLTGVSDQSQYKRMIVLQSDSKTYIFPVDTFITPGVQKTFQYLNMDLLNSGISTHIAVSDLEPGTYTIGFLFKNKMTQQSLYMFTSKTIISSTDQLELNR